MNQGNWGWPMRTHHSMNTKGGRLYRVGGRRADVEGREEGGFKRKGKREWRKRSERGGKEKEEEGRLTDVFEWTEYDVQQSEGDQSEVITVDMNGGGCKGKWSKRMSSERHERPARTRNEAQESTEKVYWWALRDGKWPGRAGRAGKLCELGRRKVPESVNSGDTRWKRWRKGCTRQGVTRGRGRKYERKRRKKERWR